MEKAVLYFERNEAGRFKQVRKPVDKYNQAVPELPAILEKLRIEWRRRNLSTQEFAKLEALSVTLKQPEVQEFTKKIYEKSKSFFTSDIVKGVLKNMSSSNFSELLKKLTENEDANKVMEQVLQNPTLSKDAMELMKDVLNDEEKFKSLTEVMSSMLNKDNK